VQTAYSEHRNGVWPDGVSFVALEQLSDPAHIPAAIAEALDIEFAGHEQPLTELAQVIGKREMLLILDNFEQLAAGNTSVYRLLPNCTARRRAAFPAARPPGATRVRARHGNTAACTGHLQPRGRTAAAECFG
jgi:predicted ATPase